MRLLEGSFLTRAWFWLLNATQNPCYATWRLLLTVRPQQALAGSERAEAGRLTAVLAHRPSGPRPGKPLRLMGDAAVYSSTWLPSGVSSAGSSPLCSSAG